MIYDESKTNNIETEKQATAEQLSKRVSGLWQRLNKDEDLTLPDFGPKYTFVDSHLGTGVFENTWGSCRQLVTALSLSANPLMNELAEKEQITPDDIGKMVENKILAGTKIIDLGCGKKPTFARIARQMGADVYTVDRLSSDGFYVGKNMPKEQRAEEVKKHIQLDLYDPNVVEKLREATGGNLDMATDAHLESDLFGDGEKIGLQLVKENGIYFSSCPQDKITVK